MVELTRDAFFDGRLTVFQEREGYRFSIDAILLAAAVSPRPGDTLLDLGTGVGIIPLILALRFPEIHIGAVEIQSALAHIAIQNVAANHLDKRIHVVQEDLCSLPSGGLSGPFDWVVSNPPYRRSRSGRINPNSQRAMARHEITVDLEKLLNCARRMLRTGGQFATIYPAERATDLFERMRQTGIEPKRLQTVHSQHGQDARLVLLQGAKGGRPGLCIAPPLIIFEPDGTYTQAIESLMHL